MTCIRPRNLQVMQNLLSVNQATYLSLSKGSLGDYQRQYGLHHLAIVEGATEVLKTIGNLEILHSYIHTWEVWSQPLRLLRYVGLEKFETTIDVAQSVDDFRKKLDLAEFFLASGLFSMGLAALSGSLPTLSKPNQQLYWKFRGELLVKLGEFQQGAAAFYSWLDLVDEKESVERGEIYNDLGVLHIYQRNFEQAVDYLEQALALCRTELPKTDDLVLSIMTNLGAAFHQQNQVLRSLELSQTVLDIRMQTLSEKHPTVLSSLHNIGTLLINLKKYQEARERLEYALELRTQVLGHRHPARLKTQYAVATVYFHLLEWELCEATYRENIRLKKETLGADHLETQSAQMGLVTAYRFQRKPEQGREIIESVYLSRQKQYGEEHALTLEAKEEYAALLHDVRDESSLLTMRSILETRHKAFGKYHPDTLRTQRNLAGFYVQLERYDEAIDMYQQIVDTVQESKTFDPSFIMGAQQDLACVLRLHSKFRASIRIWKRVYNLVRNDHSKIGIKVQAMEEIGWCELGLGRIEKSITRFQKLRTVFKPHHWKHHYMQVGCNLCQVVQAGKWDEQALDPIRERVDVDINELRFINRLILSIQKTL